MTRKSRLPLSEVLMNGIPYLGITVYQMIPMSLRGAVCGLFGHGSSSQKAIVAISEGMNGWRAIWVFGRLKIREYPDTLDGIW